MRFAALVLLGFAMLPMRMHVCRKQIKWIESRLVPAHASGLSIHRINATSIDNWDEAVFAPALLVCRAALAAQTVPLSTSLDGRATASASSERSDHDRHAIGELKDAKSLDGWKKYSCEPCGRVLNGQKEFTVHNASATHKKRVGALAKRARNERRKQEASRVRALGLEDQGNLPLPDGTEDPEEEDIAIAGFDVSLERKVPS